MLVFVAVHVRPVLQQQFAHVRLALVRSMHEGGHPILEKRNTPVKRLYDTSAAVGCLRKAFKDQRAPGTELGRQGDDEAFYNSNSTVG